LTGILGVLPVMQNPLTDAQNVRMVNSVFEDRTRPEFNPEANSERFLRHIPDYAAHGSPLGPTHHSPPATQRTTTALPVTCPAPAAKRLFM
jgi:hypothetical protein